MTKQDLEMMNEDEIQTIDDSFDQMGPYVLMRNMTLTAFVVVTMVALFVRYGASPILVGTMFAIYVAVTTVEKFTYARSQVITRSAMSKLVRRLERVENVPMTPDNGRPSRKVRLVA